MKAFWKVCEKKNYAAVIAAAGVLFRFFFQLHLALCAFETVNDSSQWTNPACISPVTPAGPHPNVQFHERKDNFQNTWGKHVTWPHSNQVHIHANPKWHLWTWPFDLERISRLEMLRSITLSSVNFADIHYGWRQRTDWHKWVLKDRINDDWYTSYSCNTRVTIYMNISKSISKVKESNSKMTKKRMLKDLQKIHNALDISMALLVWHMR